MIRRYPSPVAEKQQLSNKQKQSYKINASWLLRNENEQH